MKMRVTRCGTATIKTLPKDSDGEEIDIIVICQREEEHKGKHVGLWQVGWLTWARGKEEP